MKPNGVIFQIRKGNNLVPVVVTLERPNEAVNIEISQSLYYDLGVDKVAIVHAVVDGSRIRIARIGAVFVLDNGDSTTAAAAINKVVESGKLELFIDQSLSEFQASS